MKIFMILGAVPLLIGFMVVNQNCSKGSANAEEKNMQVIQSEKNPFEKKEDEEIWMPTAIEQCISKVDVKEPFEMATSINPFYLRADFDGNDFVDYAVLIKGKNTKKNGLVICKDSKTPFVFGAISNPKTPLSTFEDDNFVSNNWEISTKEETRNTSMKPPFGKGKIGTDAKGESVAFIFEGGSLFIYWDGKTFRVIEGG